MNVRDYAVVTLAYWAFTLTDGALRMLVLLHFHEMGFSSLQLAFLFLLYEFCGVVTNLFGGWIASRFGLKLTLYLGLAIQVAAVTMLSFLDPGWTVGVSVAFVMASQALSGIAKDLTKMSSKSAVKLVVPGGNAASGGEGRLFRWVAILTGSKNALKGVGFFLGAALLSWVGFQTSLWWMAGLLVAVLVLSLLLLDGDLGRAKSKAKFSALFAKSREINLLSAARLFLFASRDVWFVVGLPVFLTEAFDWSFWQTGSFMATWIVGYGAVQALAPALVRKRSGGEVESAARAAFLWGAVLVVLTVGIAAAVQWEFAVTQMVLGGLAVFGVVFAMNSSLHSYLVLAYSDADRVTLDVGFYYMANALGRLVGTLFSGLMYLAAGLAGCLWMSAGMVLVAVLITAALFRGGRAGANAELAGDGEPSR